MDDNTKFKPNPDLKLLDQVREVMQYYHYKYWTEQTYCDWITRFIKHYHCQRDPREMRKVEIESFLSHILHSRVWPTLLLWVRLW